MTKEIEKERENADRLRGAVREGDADEVRRLLAEGVDPDAWGLSDANGDLPLQSAVRSGSERSPEIVEALLRAGADPNHAGDYGATALHRTVYKDRRNRREMVRLLIRGGAEVSERLLDADGLNAAEAALSECNEDAVLAMLDEGINPRTSGVCGSLLWYAAWDSPRVVARLLESGAYPDGGDGDFSCGEYRPILRAAESVGSLSEFRASSDEFACLRLLLEAGASPEERGIDGRNAWDLLGRHAGAARAELERRTLEREPFQSGKSSTQKRI